MRLRPAAGDVLWMVAGAALVSLLALVVWLFGTPPNPAAQLAARAQRVALVARMQLGLASAAEAEKSAVLAITDEESQAFADQARASTASVERDRQELEKLLEPGGTQGEKDLLAEFSQKFGELQRIDAEVLRLAVENTNLKAYALAYGPAAKAIDEMGAALSRLVDAAAATPDAKQVTSLALGAEVAALRLETLLAPHIAEARDARMDELEARMKEQDEHARSALDGLAKIPKLGASPDLAAAVSRYGEFRDIESQILVLSRKNTNVLSLSLSLNEKRKATVACEDVLSRLREAIEQEPVPGETRATR